MRDVLKTSLITAEPRQHLIVHSFGSPLPKILVYTKPEWLSKLFEMALVE